MIELLPLTDSTESLKCNDEKILYCVTELKRQREELMRSIRKQEEEKAELTLEMEKNAYRMNNLSKSLAQRIVARDRYDEAISEAEEYYNKLVKSSQALLSAVEKDFKVLNESMDKKCGPEVILKKSCQAPYYQN